MSANPIAPELPSTLQWLNVQHAPVLEKLRGRIVLLHFFNAANVNSLHMTQDLRSVEIRHHDGLSVIGIHTPKFDHERQPDNVLKAVNRMHLSYPVASDADWVAWRQFGIQAWPSVAVIDAEGRIAGVIAGEGNRAQIDALVGSLLEDAANRDIRFYEPTQPVSRPEPRTPLAFPGKVMLTDTALFVADSGHNRVLECTHDGRIIRQIGTGTNGYLDGKFGDAAFNDPQGMALIKDMLYVADRGNHCIRRVHMITGEVDTVAGTGQHGRPATQDYSEPTTVALNSPWDLIAANEKLFIAMAGQHQIWALDLNRKRLNLYSGTGKIGRDDGDGMFATFAKPTGLAYVNQVLYVADADGSAIRAVRSDGRVQTLVGAGLYEFGDVDGPPAQVRLQHPMSVAADANGQILWLVDTYNNKLKALSLRGGGAKSINLAFRFNQPSGVASLPGKLFVANTGAHEVVRIDTSNGQVTRLPIGE
ncbi:MAG: hypothetical protein IT478_03475 [Xanthomonadales bacterium]|nr:hypothetical protein [Xanthomonadales bacterium]